MRPSSRIAASSSQVAGGKPAAAAMGTGAPASTKAVGTNSVAGSARSRSTGQAWVWKLRKASSNVRTTAGGRRSSCFEQAERVVQRYHGATTRQLLHVAPEVRRWQVHRHVHLGTDQVVGEHLDASACRDAALQRRRGASPHGTGRSACRVKAVAGSARGGRRGGRTGTAWRLSGTSRQ